MSEVHPLIQRGIRKVKVACAPSGLYRIAAPVLDTPGILGRQCSEGEVLAVRTVAHVEDTGVVEGTDIDPRRNRSRVVAVDAEVRCALAGRDIVAGSVAINRHAHAGPADLIRRVEHRCAVVAVAGAILEVVLEDVPRHRTGRYRLRIHRHVGLQPVASHHVKLFVVNHAVPVAFGGIINLRKGRTAASRNTRRGIKPDIIDVQRARTVGAAAVLVADADYYARNITQRNAEVGKVDVPVVPRGLIEIIEALAFKIAVEDLSAVAGAALELHPERLRHRVASQAVESKEKCPDAAHSPVGAYTRGKTSDLCLYTRVHQMTALLTHSTGTIDRTVVVELVLHRLNAAKNRVGILGQRRAGIVAVARSAVAEGVAPLFKYVVASLSPL